MCKNISKFLLLLFTLSVNLTFSLQESGNNINVTTRILNGPNSNNVHQQISRPTNSYPDQNSQGSGNHPVVNEDSGIPAIYVQIMMAIEKIVGRLDDLDKRLRTIENVVLYLTQDNNKAESTVNSEKRGKMIFWGNNCVFEKIFGWIVFFF